MYFANLKTKNVENDELISRLLHFLTVYYQGIILLFIIYYIKLCFRELLIYLILLDLAVGSRY